MNTWFNNIIDCQNEISNLSSNSYYASAYKNEELFYWHHIANWIYEDNFENKIANCLDIGCAYGTLALYSKKLFNCNIYCTDFIATCLSKALIEKYNFIFSVNNIELDPFPWDEKFDMIIFTEVLEHLNFHPLSTLQKIYNLLEDTGTLYLSTPDASAWGRVTKYYSTLDNMPYASRNLPIINDHVYIFNKNELIDLIKEAGFKIKRSDYATGSCGKQHFNLALTK